MFKATILDSDNWFFGDQLVDDIVQLLTVTPGTPALQTTMLGIRVNNKTR